MTAALQTVDSQRPVVAADTASSKRIAQLLGPSITAVTATEAFNFRIWAGDAVSLAPVVYLNGAVLFVAGLALVRAHNRWTLGWPLLITLAGWFVLLLGLVRMIAPVSSESAVQHGVGTMVGIVLLLGVGIFLTFKAYSRGQ